MGRLRLLIAWVLATAVAMGLAFGAVSIVAGDITEGPRELASSTPSVAVPADASTATTLPIGAGTELPTSEDVAASTVTTASTAPDEDGAGPSTTEELSPTTTGDGAGPSTTEESSPSTTEDDSASTTTEDSPSTTDSSTSSTSASSSTTVPAVTLTETVSFDGNWARFSCAGNVAGLEAYGAGSGYRLAEAPQISGDEGKVEFESSDGATEVDFRVKCEDGSIETWAEVEGES